MIQLQGERLGEEHIHRFIGTSGVIGTFANLEEEAVVDFKLPAQTSRFFETFKEIDDSAQYWCPTSKVHSTCDAYIPKKEIMLQITIGQEHTINMDGLEQIIDSGIFRKWKTNIQGSHLNLCLLLTHQLIHNSKKSNL